MAEFRSSVEEEIPRTWILFVDGASNLKGLDIGIVLEGPNYVFLEHSVKFDFKANFN